MNTYLFLYRHPVRETPQVPSPEQMQEMLAQWQDWKARFSDNVADMGDGLDHSGRVLRADGTTDGPFVEAKEVVGGFSIIKAKTYEEAAEVAAACPVRYVPGFSVEIRKMEGL